MALSSRPHATAGLVVLLTALWLAPGAAAQTEEVVDPVASIEIVPTPYGQPLAPSTGGTSITGTASVQVKVKCPQPSAYTSPVVVEHGTNANADYVFAGVSEPTHSVEFSPPDCVAEETVKEYPVTVDFVFGRNAPAFSEVKLAFLARPTNASEPFRGEWTESVGFGGTFDTRVVSDFELVDGKVPIEFEVTNSANGPIDVVAEVDIAPSQGVLDPTSARLTVPSRATDGNDKATFTLLYTPNIKATDQFSLEVTAVSADDDSYVLRPVLVDVKIDNENGAIYGNSTPAAEGPGPGVLMVVLLGLVAVGLARRR